MKPQSRPIGFPQFVFVLWYTQCPHPRAEHTTNTNLGSIHTVSSNRYQLNRSKLSGAKFFDRARDTLYTTTNVVCSHQQQRNAFLCSLHMRIKRRSTYQSVNNTTSIIGITILAIISYLLYPLLNSISSPLLALSKQPLL